MNNYAKVVLVIGLCAAFAVGGALLMAPTQAATNLGDAASLSLDNEFTGRVNQFPSIKIGKQGVGGVTFFNGTIINATTGSNGSGVPVTFGDDVRIDGELWRGAEAGTADSQPLKINDNVEVSGGINVSGDVNVLGDNYLKLGVRHSAPPASDCENDSQTGRMLYQKLEGDDFWVWICRGSDGWYGS
jgi:hypothetical protein